MKRGVGGGGGVHVSFNLLPRISCTKLKSFSTHSHPTHPHPHPTHHTPTHTHTHTTHPHTHTHTHTPHTSLQYFVASCLKLEHLLRVSTLPKQDIYFVLSNLVRMMAEAIDSGDNERSEYISAVTKNVFSQHFSRSELTNQLPGLPSPQSPSFSTEFVKYSETKEWMEYRSGVVSE